MTQRRLDVLRASSLMFARCVMVRILVPFAISRAQRQEQQPRTKTRSASLVVNLRRWEVLLLRSCRNLRGSVPARYDPNLVYQPGGLCVNVSRDIAAKHDVDTPELRVGC